MRLKYLAQTWVILTTKFVYFFTLWVTSTMSKPSYQCSYCKRNNFASLKGITQHQQQNRVCFNKHAGKPVCLTWELKGSCSSGCRRHENHKRYSRTTIQAIHGILDKCGVAQAWGRPVPPRGGSKPRQSCIILDRYKYFWRGPGCTNPE